MAISKKEFTQYIREFKFKELFNDMGWEKDKTNQNVTVDNTAYPLEGLAEKRGFKILLCRAADGSVPEYAIRKKIENKVTKLFQEHLIIYVDAKNQEQVWQIVVRQIGKPTKVSETSYHVKQDPELLFQRASGIIFELDEEEKITIVDVTQRITDNFQQNNERVTKQFYDKFSKEHTSFLKFIKGIEDNVDKEWYASLMLNRLMFCYFIQKKGFLDSNKNYLLDKLKASQEKKGKNKFYSFYRSFLLTLFHQGLGAPDHSKDLKDEIGKVPYLNGGLFEEHELEANNPKIDIDDKAFERIFGFFDQYEWHLDTRHTASGKDINPDVIGYIFEKYINDRAQMGAYYTKEDITDYISKNCVLPFLFDETKRHYAKAFDASGEIWSLVKNSGDKYIYTELKHGVDKQLPKEIAKGLKDIPARTEWNKQAPSEFALPTEIWREVIDRRRRYEFQKSEMADGKVLELKDFITHNLNIGQFVQDIIENTNDADFLREFYKALTSVTIIDPTCGSGAFLFAAMNILEPLYEACVVRMRAFVEDEDRVNKDQKSTFSHKHKFFREVLENIQSPQHPNLQYFIYKSIILRNLYGVDIMKEAVEIAKLRLFLKLVATVEADYRKPNLGLEPLPDIDFNIRAGNTLIGFATEAELNKGLTYTLDGAQAKPAIEEKMEIVSKTYARYKDIQLSYGDDYKQFKKAKDDLAKRLKELNHELNQLLYKQNPAIKYEKWLETHQPFHWFAEFYETIHDNGGFDVIIGNPPYVEYKDVKDVYTIRDFRSQESGDLYAFVMERSLSISSETSKLGFIIPMSCFTVDGFATIQNLYYKNNDTLHISNWSGDAHPSKLFEGVDKRLHIVLASRAKNDQSRICKTYVTRYIKWYSDERSSLFDVKTNYYLLDKKESAVFPTSLPKLSSKIEESILKKIKKCVSVAQQQSPAASSHVIYYTRKVSFFLQFLDFIPTVKDSEGKTREPSELKTLFFDDDHTKNVILSGFNSSVFYWFYITNSDCRNLNKREIVNFSVPVVDSSHKKIFKSLVKKLMTDFVDNSTLRTVTYKGKGAITVQYFNFRLSKRILDEIDSTLADHYDFSKEELDFLINYDVKYRLGKELEEEED
ncbi:MAG TPA: Eco57I restriction-modification methylase domain-containing protein [Cyclobacteriaceae bacterium]|nr:Eco57I restriction-modification methylase domain-containing protein [Cyclobacteriaceae bacterium]